MIPMFTLSVYRSFTVAMRQQKILWKTPVGRPRRGASSPLWESYAIPLRYHWSDMNGIVWSETTGIIWVRTSVSFGRYFQHLSVAKKKTWICKLFCSSRLSTKEWRTLMKNMKSSSSSKLFSLLIPRIIIWQMLVPLYSRFILGISVSIGN